MDRILEKLRQHRSATPSRWREEAEYRQSNISWLKQSREIAIRLLSAMRSKGLTKDDLSKATGLDEGNILRLLKGKEKVESETIIKLEKALAIDLTI